MSLFNMMTSGGGSGGMEYETGAVSMTSYSSTFTAQFSKQHTKPPALVLVISADSSTPSYSDSFYGVFDFETMLGNLWAVDTAGRNKYGYRIQEQSRGSNMSQTSAILINNKSTSGDPTSTTDMRYYLKEDSFKTYGAYQSGCTLLWIAIWLPDNWTPPTA